MLDYRTDFIEFVITHSGVDLGHDDMHEIPKCLAREQRSQIDGNDNADGFLLALVGYLFVLELLKSKKHGGSKEHRHGGIMLFSAYTHGRSVEHHSSQMPEIVLFAGGTNIVDRTVVARTADRSAVFTEAILQLFFMRFFKPVKNTAFIRD